MYKMHYRHIFTTIMAYSKCCEQKLPCRTGLKIGRGIFQCSHVKKYSTKNDPTQKRKIDKKSAIDSFGAWDNNEMPSLLVEASIQHGCPIPHISVPDIGCSSIVGKRTYQEDRYFIKEYSESLLCCAVFDGHGGSECSEFCASHCEDILNRTLTDDCDIDAVLHNTILELNSSYKDWTVQQSKGHNSGTTCTLCVLRDGVELFLAHVGDSRALVCRNGAPRRLTVDHCPSNALEKKRIIQSGGRVGIDNIGRHMVNGALNMSRSIGDFHLKSYGVTAIPDTRSFKIKHGKDSFFLLGTDGINYVLQDKEICNIINHAPDTATAASALTEQALSMSSEDNLTALVIPLGSWGKFEKSASSMFYSFGIGRDMTKSSRFG